MGSSPAQGKYQFFQMGVSKGKKKCTVSVDLFLLNMSFVRYLFIEFQVAKYIQRKADSNFAKIIANNNAMNSSSDGQYFNKRPKC